VNAVVRVKLPPVPVTVIVHEPVGVDVEVLMVHVLEKVGLPEARLNDAVEPAGSPEADNDTV